MAPITAHVAEKGKGVIAATTIKYATLMPLFYLFYSLYESVKNKPELRI